jgi:hypothetical protein
MPRKLLAAHTLGETGNPSPGRSLWLVAQIAGLIRGAVAAMRATHQLSAVG